MDRNSSGLLSAISPSLVSREVELLAKAYPTLEAGGMVEAPAAL